MLGEMLDEILGRLIMAELCYIPTVVLNDQATTVHFAATGTASDSLVFSRESDFGS